MTAFCAGRLRCCRASGLLKRKPHGCTWSPSNLRHFGEKLHPNTFHTWFDCWKASWLPRVSCMPHVSFGFMVRGGYFILSVELRGLQILLLTSFSSPSSTSPDLLTGFWPKDPCLRWYSPLDLERQAVPRLGCLYFLDECSIFLDIFMWRFRM